MTTEATLSTLERGKTLIARLETLSKIALVLVISGYVLMYLVVAGLRISYPFELEWMEGGSVDHVRRVLAGQPLYVPPSLDFIPYVYTPLYWWLSALAALLTGIGFFPLRLVSFLSSLVALLFIFLIVRKEAGRGPGGPGGRGLLPGLFAVGLFAATYRVSGAWLDIARPDSLCLALLLAAAYLLQDRATLPRYLLAGTCLAASFLTKQTALAVSLPLLLYALFENRRLGLWTAGIFVVLAAGTTLVLNAASQGWYAYYTLELPRHHPIVGTMAIGFWTDDIAKLVGIAFLASGLYLVNQALAPRPHWRNALFGTAFALGMIGGAWWARMHSGANFNALLPAFAAIAVLGGSSLGAAIHAVQGWGPGAEEGAGGQRAVRLSLYLACLFQLASLIYNPLDEIPTREDRAAGWEWIQRVARVKGETYVPFHGYLPVLAGKRTHAQGCAVWEVLKGGGDRAEALQREMDEAVRSQRFQAVVVDSNWFLPLLEEYYCLEAEPAFRSPGGRGSRGAFFTVTGMKTRPGRFYFPRIPPRARNDEPGIEKD